MSSFKTNIILVKKTQEHKTTELIECINSLTLKDKKIAEIKQRVRNCEIKNLDNIISEVFKRLIVPLYLPSLMLIALLLIVHSKEKVNYSKHRIKIFVIGLLVIIFSELTLRFVNNSFNNNLVITLIPIILCIFLYNYFLFKFKVKKIL